MMYYTCEGLLILGFIGSILSVLIASICASNKARNCWWVVSVLLVIMFLFGCVDLISWYRMPYQKVQCTLVNTNFIPSTSTTHSFMTYDKNGMKPGVAHSSTPEKYITIWDCGKLGNLICYREDVFRYAKQVSILHIKKKSDEVWICGIT